MSRLRFSTIIGPRPPKGGYDIDVTFAPMETLSDGIGGLSTSQVRRYNEVSSGSYNFFGEGDLLLAKVTPCFENGKKAIARNLENGMGFATSEVHVIRPHHDKVDTRFLLYTFCSEDFRAAGMASMTGSGGLRRVSENAIRDFTLKIQDLPTQRTIADFLDRETARIDQLIQKKQRLVELIKEREAAKLEALTFGHPKAKSYEHYPFKWACRIPQGQVDPKDNKWKDKPLIAPNHIESKTGRLFYVESAEEQGAISGKYAFPKGTVVYSKIRPALAKACIAPTAGLCSADMYPIIPFKNLLPEFLLMQLLTYSFTDWAILESMRVAMPKINRETIGSIKLIVPPISTQKELISLHDKSKRLAEATIDKTNQSIHRLREFRSALITAAVTGQIDVNEWSRRGGTDAKLDAIAQEMEARA